MSTEKAKVTENIQKYIDKGDWKAVVSEMERLFAIDPDPMVRVRMGDARQKLGHKAEAVKEYVMAADMYAENGFVVKALALYKLALRLDPSNKKALENMARLHSNEAVSQKKAEPVEAGRPQPAHSVIPLFADFTQEEFDDFVKRLTIQTVPGGRVIIREGEGGNSVFVITRGSVRVYTVINGRTIYLAELGPSEFFGEIAFLTGRPRTATVETKEETDLLEISEEELLDLIAHRPRIREILQKYYELRVKNTIEKVKAS